MYRLLSLVLILGLLLGGQTWASCVAPPVDRCAKVKVHKVLSRSFRMYGRLPPSCIVEGDIIVPKKGKTKFFIHEGCAEAGEIVYGHLTWYFGCTDAGWGLEKDPTMPGLSKVPRQECETIETGKK